MMSVKTLAEMMLSFGPMSNKKLQKICYYAYAWYMTLYNQKLAPLYFEAWVHGPVSRELYHQYKQYGWDSIPQHRGFVMADNKTIAFARRVWEIYGGCTAQELEDMTHREFPWMNARTGCTPYESSDVLLSDSDIQYFYSKQKDIFLY